MIYYYCQFSSRRSVDEEERRIVQVEYLVKWWKRKTEFKFCQATN